MVNVLFTQLPFFATICLLMIGVVCEPKSLPNRMFCTKKSTEAKKVVRGTFIEIKRQQIQMYPQSSIEPKYGAV